MAGLCPYQDAEKVRYASGFDSPAALLDGLFEHLWDGHLLSLDATIVLPQPVIARRESLLA